MTGEPPVLWGTSIVGFGTYHYRYESGHEGDSALVGFSPRKGNLVLYLIGGFADRHQKLLDELGPHKTGKGCLYLKNLADIDLDVLRRARRPVDADPPRRRPRLSLIYQDPAVATGRCGCGRARAPLTDLSKTARTTEPVTI